MVAPSSDHWSVKFRREVYQWDHDFTEHWTYKYRDGTVTYKLRVVGPNGEVCSRKDMPKDEAPSEVRHAFEDAFREAGGKA